jgi:hypothetical protein
VTGTDRGRLHGSDHQRRGTADPAVAGQNGHPPGPIELGTAGEFAAFMVRLPANTPIHIAEHVRVDPDLDVGNTPVRSVTSVTIVSPDDELTTTTDHDSGQSHDPRRVVPGLELGTVIVAKDGHIPPCTAAYEPYERAIEAIRDGNVDMLFDAELQLLTFVANILDGTFDDATSQRDLYDDPRCQLRTETTRLRLSLPALRRGAPGWRGA